MSAPWAPLQTGQTFEAEELPPRAQRQVGVRGLVGTREDVDALAPTCWQEYSRHFVDISLHGFNILAFLWIANFFVNLLSSVTQSAGRNDDDDMGPPRNY